MTSNWKKQCAALALAAAMTASSVVSPLVYAADAALQAEVGSEPAVSASAGSEPASSEPAASTSVAGEPEADASGSSEAVTSEPESGEPANSVPESSEPAVSEPPQEEESQEEPEAPAEQQPEQPAAQEDLSWVDSDALAMGWYDGFEQTKTITNAQVKQYWPAGVMPEAWVESIWPATVSPNMLFEVVPEGGSNTVHVKSENATGRADFFRWFENLDYEQDYVLKMRVKTSNFQMVPTGTDNLIKVQVGDKGNKLLTGATPANGTSDGWVDFEIKLEGLKAAAAGEDNEGMLKVELYPCSMTGEV